ncbi:hypothetical protein ACETK8_03505 [Brevundimonas staleyi]|uniref:DUF4136 domain-containing protein n=1 Tax=Brevundimonas staleyi TaxID=74326 RepID=A0ABW0FU23_9CAUL
MALLASPTLACTMIVAMPEPGETWAQAQLRSDRQQQRDNWARADAVYLVRVTENLEEPYISRGRPVVALKGQISAGYLDVLNGCAAWAPGSVAIVFVERAAATGWQTFDSLAPSEVRDPQLVTHLQRTAERLRNGRTQ